VRLYRFADGGSDALPLLRRTDLVRHRHEVGQLILMDADRSEFFEALAPDVSEQELQLRIRSPKVRLVFRHWQDSRDGRLFPRRSDIDPAAMREALPHITVTQISYEPLRVLYRLVGTEVARWSKQDFTNCYADELVFQDDDRDWTDYYRQVIERRAVCFGITYWREPYARGFWIEHMICPLSSDGVTIDQCLAVEDYEKMSWREFEALPPVVPRQG
jgi:hypothetical protein